jgi:hypothetical protein
MDIHCNGGVISTDLIGDLPDTAMSGITQMELQTSFQEKHRVTFDSSDQNEFVVHKDDSTT